MSYNMHFSKLKHFDRENNDFGLPTWDQSDRDASRQRAESIGWLLMYVHQNEITEDNIEEIIFRMQFADTIHGSPFMKKDGKEISLEEIREQLRRHIGLETNGTVSTRHKFIVNVAKNLANDVDYQLSKDLEKLDA